MIRHTTEQRRKTAINTFTSRPGAGEHSLPIFEIFYYDYKQK